MVMMGRRQRGKTTKDMRVKNQSIENSTYKIVMMVNGRLVKSWTS